MGKVSRRLFFILFCFHCLIPGKVAAASPRVITLLQELIRADTTNPPGHEIRAAQILKKHLDRAPRIETKIVESAPGRANLIARLPGRGERDPLILLGHLDVVTANPKEWSVPPFAGEIRDGYLWGRGAIDMKGMVSMEAEALLEFAASDAKLAGDLLLIAVADEEAGGVMGLEWLLKRYGGDLKAGGVINEGSIGIKREKEGFDLFPIQVAEKGVCWIKVTAKGKPGHGSMPHQENAVLRLNRAMQIIGDYPFPLQETPIMKKFARAIAPRLAFPNSFLMGHLFTPLLGLPVRWLARPGIVHEKALFAMLTHTATPTGLQAGKKINVIPSGAVGSIDARILPGKTPEEFRDFLQGLVGNDVTLEIVGQSLPNESSTDTKLYRTIANVLSRHYPQATVTPILSTGASDSRFFRARGIPSYGLIPILLPEKDLAGLHGIDERISIDQLSKGVTILKEIIQNTLQ